MPPRVRVGVNLNFAKFVYGRHKAIDIVRDEFGLRLVETVPDIDFGPTFYHTNPDAFRRYHLEVAEYAESRGVDIASILTFYRDMGAIAHPDHDIRESAYRVGLSVLEMARCYKARFASASLFTMNKEMADDPEQFQSLFDSALDIWKRWLHDANRLGIPCMLIEMAATFREGFSTLDDVRRTLEILDGYHWENKESTVPVGICYDTGHGISQEESPHPRERDFAAWFHAFPHRIHEIHLKDTDRQFQETFHFGSEHGTIDLDRLIFSVRDTLTVDEVLLLLEVPGKRGRDIGEKRALEQHRQSIELIRQALRTAEYVYDDGDDTWTAPEE